MIRSVGMSLLQSRLRSGQFVVTAEITPPVSTDPAEFLKRALPLNEPVVIEFTPAKGEIAFACGMGMLHGTVLVQ